MRGNRREDEDDDGESRRAMREMFKMTKTIFSISTGGQQTKVRRKGQFRLELLGGGGGG